MTDQPLAILRREIDYLGRQVGDVIRRTTGDSGLSLVEEVRRLLRCLHAGDAGAVEELRSLLGALDFGQLKTVIRGFTVFLELSNLAEDRERVRVLRQRARSHYPEPRRESLRAAIAMFHQQGMSSGEVQGIVDQVGIDLVLTAHPTEAKRRSVRRLLGSLRRMLQEKDQGDLLPGEIERLDERFTAELLKLWQTDFIRPWRPSVLDEVQRGLAIKSVLWDEVPALMADMRRALAQYYPKVSLGRRSLVRFGSWIGGDRDGNPFVTPAVTAQTLEWLRHAALDYHLVQCRKMAASLSLSDRQAVPAASLRAAIRNACERWPELSADLDKLPPLETYRRWLYVIERRLQASQRVGLEATSTDSLAYRRADDLYSDVSFIAESLRRTGAALIADGEVAAWLDQIAAFGLHTAALDVRQHSAVYREVIDELWRVSGRAEKPEQLDEAARCDLLAEKLEIAWPLTDASLSDASVQTLELFALLRRVARAYGIEALGGHVISMTHEASDVLTVLALWNWSAGIAGGNVADADLRMPIIPLFETIDDLKRAPATLDALLAQKVYRAELQAQGDVQCVMIGYSDSTKDGGYLAAQWALQNAQALLQQTAEGHGVQLTFFHGRGGSLGRGGGPAARGILSLPRQAFSGSLRITEQGEVLAERYDNPQIAHRHLEQVVWAVLTASTRKLSPLPSGWQRSIEMLADYSLRAYRELVDHPRFGEFYRSVTPINAIERLPIGSRPSKRKVSGGIEDLRAIPWVFSWTQCRALLPAWYGIGTAFDAYCEADSQGVQSLQQMYRDWPFFRASIDNASLGLAQANMPVFRKYAELGQQIDGSDALAEAIVQEYERSCRAVVAINGRDKLLDEIPWLQRAIQIRNGYVDALNLVQIELLRRRAKCAELEIDDADELEHLTQMVIKGVSTGMRTTG